LLLRLWFYPTRVLQLVGRLMLPLWVTLAVLTEEASALPEFGLFSASMQSGWLGPVDVHLDAMIAAARFMVARKLPSVLS
jgi:hypothetical protein